MISVHCFLLLIFLMERIKLHKSVHNILIRQPNAQLYIISNSIHTKFKNNKLCTNANKWAIMVLNCSPESPEYQPCFNSFRTEQKFRNSDFNRRNK